MRYTTLARATNQCLACPVQGWSKLLSSESYWGTEVCQAVGRYIGGEDLASPVRETRDLALEENTYWQAPKQKFRAAQCHSSSQATIPDVQCLQGRAHKQLQRSGPDAGAALPRVHLPMPQCCKTNFTCAFSHNFSKRAAWQPGQGAMMMVLLRLC